MKFNIGDRVRIVRCNNIDNKVFTKHINSIGTITNITYNYQFIIKSIPFAWKEEEIEFAVDIPKW
jgi:hypothetical protein